MAESQRVKQARVPDSKPPPKAMSAWQVALTELLEGFVESSTTAFLALLVGLGLGIFALFWFFSPSTIAGPMGAYLPRSSSDAAAFATREALVLGRTPVRAPRMLILGPSTIAQAIALGDTLSTEIESNSGIPWNVHVLTTPVQSPFDQMALIETALKNHDPEGPPVLIVLGVGLQRLGWSMERLTEYESMARIGVRSDWVDEEMLMLGMQPRARTGIYLLDNYRFVIGERTETIVRLALQRPVPRTVDIYSKGQSMNLGERPYKSMLFQITAGQADASTYFELHARLAERLEAFPGVYLAFIEEPLAPDFLAARGLLDEQAGMHVALREFTRRIGAVYWPVVTEAGLQPADYHDNLHLKRGPAQERVQRALARHVSDFARHLQDTP